MDFNDTPQEAAFRAEVQNWLTANVPTEAELADMDYIGRAKLWQKKKPKQKLIMFYLGFLTSKTPSK